MSVFQQLLTQYKCMCFCVKWNVDYTEPDWWRFPSITHSLSSVTHTHTHLWLHYHSPYNLISTLVLLFLLFYLPFSILLLLSWFPPQWGLLFHCDSSQVVSFFIIKRRVQHLGISAYYNEPKKVHKLSLTNEMWHSYAIKRTLAQFNICLPATALLYLVWPLADGG